MSDEEEALLLSSWISEMIFSTWHDQGVVLTEKQLAMHHQKKRAAAAAAAAGPPARCCSKPRYFRLCSFKNEFAKRLTKKDATTEIEELDKSIFHDSCTTAY